MSIVLDKKDKELFSGDAQRKKRPVTRHEFGYEPREGDRLKLLLDWHPSEKREEHKAALLRLYLKTIGESLQAKSSHPLVKTDEAEAFIREAHLGSVVNEAIDVVEKVFSDIHQISLELNEGDGDKYIRLYVDSDMHGDVLLDAYENFYREFNRRCPVEQRAYIGLSF